MRPNNNLMLCPYCSGNFLLLKNLSRHVALCAKGPGGATAKILFYEEFYKFSKDDLLSEYVSKKRGLKAIFSDKGIPFKVLRFMAKHYSILRNAEDSARIGIENSRKTRLERYGTEAICEIPSVRLNLKNVSSATRKKRSDAMKRVWADKSFYEINQEKMKKAVMGKYGVNNVFLLPEFQKKAIESILLKFGVDNISKSKYKKDLLVALGKYSSEDKLVEFMRYKDQVRAETRKWTPHLYDVWESMGGQCYYTLDCLLDTDNKRCSDFKNRPSIDHKVSVLFGFLNRIPPEIIGNVQNLCICSSAINSLKRSLTERQFRDKYPEVCFSERYFS